MSKARPKGKLGKIRILDRTPKLTLDALNLIDLIYECDDTHAKKVEALEEIIQEAESSIHLLEAKKNGRRKRRAS